MKGMHDKALLLLTVTALIVLPASRARAQTADEVVEKYLTAIGGRAALGKVTSRTTTGTISVTTPAGDLTGTIELYNKAPNKVRTVVKIDASSLGVGQILQDQRFDGTAGYTIDSLNGNRDLTGDQAGGHAQQHVSDAAPSVQAGRRASGIARQGESRRQGRLCPAVHAENGTRVTTVHGR